MLSSTNNSNRLSRKRKFISLNTDWCQKHPRGLWTAKRFHSCQSRVGSDPRLRSKMYDNQNIAHKGTMLGLSTWLRVPDSCLSSCRQYTSICMQVEGDVKSTLYTLLEKLCTGPRRMMCMWDETLSRMLRCYLAADLVMPILNVKTRNPDISCYILQFLLPIGPNGGGGFMAELACILRYVRTFQTPQSRKIQAIVEHALGCMYRLFPTLQPMVSNALAICPSASNENLSIVSNPASP